MFRWVIGVDLGGTQIRAIRTDLGGEKMARSQLPTEAASGGEAVVERIFTAIEEVLEKVEPKEVIGIGIGAPGPMDGDGRIYDPPKLTEWRDNSLTARIHERFDRPPCAVHDDHRAAPDPHALVAAKACCGLD